MARTDCLICDTSPTTATTTTPTTRTTRAAQFYVTLNPERVRLWMSSLPLPPSRPTRSRTDAWWPPCSEVSHRHATTKNVCQAKCRFDSRTRARAHAKHALSIYIYIRETSSRQSGAVAGAGFAGRAIYYRLNIARSRLRLRIRRDATLM